MSQAEEAHDRSWVWHSVALEENVASYGGPTRVSTARQNVWKLTRMRAFVACLLSQKNGVVPYKHCNG